MYLIGFPTQINAISARVNRRTLLFKKYETFFVKLRHHRLGTGLEQQERNVRNHLEMGKAVGLRFRVLGAPSRSQNVHSVVVGPLEGSCCGRLHVPRNIASF